ncbi:MAG: hypothetical protein R2695_18495 [Acidimicrobiales bacterium]
MTVAAEDLILISVDDHIIEPPDLFDGHLPGALPRRRPADRATRRRGRCVALRHG